MKQKTKYQINKPRWINEVYREIKRIPELEGEYDLDSVTYEKTESGKEITTYTDLKKGWFFSYNGDDQVTLTIMTQQNLLKHLQEIKKQLEEQNEYPGSVENRIKELKILIDSKKKNKIKEMQNGNTKIKIGTLLYTSWGYDQTNVEMFRVVKILGKHYFIIQEVCLTTTENSTMTADDVIPTTTDRNVLPVRAFMDKGGFMSVSESGYKRGLFIHEKGSTHYRTNPMFGH